MNGAAMNLRPQQAAQELGVGLTKLWVLVKEEPGFPPPIKLGARTTVFRREDLHAWMAGRVAAAMEQKAERSSTSEEDSPRHVQPDAEAGKLSASSVDGSGIGSQRSEE